MLLRLLFLSLLAQCSAELFFSETFEGPDPFDAGRWIKSQDPKYVNQPVMVKTAKNVIGGFESDKGLQLTQENHYYGVSAPFPRSFGPDGKEIVVQYEVKLEETLNCGGAYLKLPRAQEGKTTQEILTGLNSDTPYSIMFGPDKCGSNNKVHFILQYQNPVTGSWQEKHFNTTISIKSDRKVHLYTLVIRSDNTFEILIDMSSAGKGSLLTHLVPPINPPPMIDDPNDVKPADWVDEAQIEDPQAVKPLDWDESQPRKVPDVSAVKPLGWLDEEPLRVPDPAASKPQDWDDEEDGEWEAPEVDNPKCEAVGCGPWTPPLVPNPLYKGKWQAPKIANPLYAGPWAPRQIPNPEHFPTETDPYRHIARMVGVSLEVWTISAGILLDNILVTDSLSEAIAFSAAHTKPKTDAELAQARAEEQRVRERDRREAAERGGFKAWAEAKVMDLFDFLNANPAALYASVAAVVIPFFWALLYGGKGVRVDENDQLVRDDAGANASEAPSGDDKKETESEEEEKEEVMDNKKNK